MVVGDQIGQGFRYNSDGDPYAIIATPVASLDLISPRVLTDQHLANARLIAAAPDLLAALKAVIVAKPQCECTDAVGCKVEAARVLARTAIF
jgi:hypothetical protein